LRRSVKETAAKDNCVAHFGADVAANGTVEYVSEYFLEIGGVLIRHGIGSEGDIGGEFGQWERRIGFAGINVDEIGN